MYRYTNPQFRSTIAKDILTAASAYGCRRFLCDDLFNHEICCDFTHMLVAEGLDPESSTAPLCGAI